MEPTTIDDPRRTAATWVAGTGAFLLLISAAVFTAVRWGDLPPLAKLAVLCGVTVAVLTGGRALGRTLPATGGAVEHLGALLVPLDAGAVAAYTGVRWPGVLLAAGATGTFAFAVVGRSLESVVLRWATIAAVVVGVIGVAGQSPVPAGLAVAVLGVVALALDRRQAALAWAGVAGLSPLLVAVPSHLLGGGVLADLGLSGRHAALLAVVTGAFAAVVFAREARRRVDAGYAFAAAVAVLLGVGTTWLSTVHVNDLLTVSAGLLTLELVALFLRHDGLWRPVAASLAVAVEVPVAVVTPIAALGVFVATALQPEPYLPNTISFCILAVAWFAADLRRQRGPLGVGVGLLVGGGWRPAFPLFALTLVTAALSTASSAVVGAALLAITAAAVVTARPFAHVTATVAAAFVPAALFDAGVAGIVGGLAAAVLLAELSVLRARAGSPTPWMPLLALVPTLGTTAWLTTADVTVGAALFLIAMSGVALLVDRGSVHTGEVVRLSALVAVLLPVDAAVIGAVVLGLIGVECMRRREPRVLGVAVVALPYWLLGVFTAAGMDPGAGGVGLTMAGVVVAGLSAVLDAGPWRAQLVRAVVVLELLGVAIASATPSTLGHALLVAGGVMVGGGVALRRGDLIHAGTLTVLAGVWLGLYDAGADVVELYATPLAAYLFGVGWVARRDGVSSWAAYSAPLAIAGGLPLLVRMLGGGGGHALVVGVVGVVTVVVGGQRRLAAPLVLGTVGCVVLAVYEAVAVRPTVPTWGWLGLAGSVLLGAGIVIERTGMTPAATGRRLADVVISEFD